MREFEHDTDCPNQSTSGIKPRSNEPSTSRSKLYEKDGNRGESSMKTEPIGSARSTECVVSHCKQPHPAWRCDVFHKLPLSERKGLMKQHRLCRCCLSPGHKAMQCKRDGCAKCPEPIGSKNHIKLCQKATYDNEFRQNDDSANANVAEQNPETTLQIQPERFKASDVVAQSVSKAVSAPLRPVLATARFRVKVANETFKEIRVICDSSSRANLLAETTLQKLGLAEQSLKSNIIKFNGTFIDTKGQVELELWHRNIDHKITTGKFEVISDFYPNQPQSSFSHLMFPNLERSEMADPHYHMIGPIDGIIGENI